MFCLLILLFSILKIFESESGLTVNSTSMHRNGEIGYVKQIGRFYVFHNGSWHLAVQDCEVRCN